MSNIFWNEQAILTLTSAGGALVQNGGGIANGTASLDVRTGGNAAENFTAGFELSVLQWATITNITIGTVIADLFLVPVLDGTNAPSVTITNASTDFIAPNYRVGSFISGVIPVANTSIRSAVINVDLQPFLYTPYLINRSGQTFTANWVLKFVSAKVQVV